MCGIAGIFLNHNDKPSLETLKDMTECLSHRGPDDSGYFVDEQIGLGHRRLAIIDLNTGHQPIFNEDKTIVTVFNGEIYNFKELRQSLLQKGHRFYTNTDTEVLVHLYEDEGEKFVHKLRGMFAIALWDKNNKKFILVRDRLGIKPLFYYRDSRHLIFGSEIKSILNFPDFRRRLQYSALYDYLSFMTTTQSETIFEDIYRLLPGQMIVASANEFKIITYWDLPQEISSKPYKKEEFREMLSEVIREHLISDVPLGAFLSGGLDSSAIVAFMSQEFKVPVKTFSIGFEESKYYDESPYAKRVAEYLGTEHQEFYVRPNLIEDVPKIIDCFDEPFAASSALPLYHLAKLAREKVKVVLTGDGADEVFGGYQMRYAALEKSRTFDKIPFLKSKQTENILKTIFFNKKRRFQKFFKGVRQPMVSRYFSFMAKFDEEDKANLLAKHILRFLEGKDSRQIFKEYIDKSNPSDFLNQFLYLDMKTSLPNEMLAKTDRMTMAFGLEARVPFLDHMLVEYAHRLPSSHKLRGFNSKYMLRTLMKDKLPPDILKRPKHGFEVPVDEWFRKDLKEYTRHYLNEARIRQQDIFDWYAVNTILTLHWEGKQNFGHHIWTLLMFQVWYDKYLT
jgi:asparagine synthase (glutamine-hydrolysing)